MSRLASFSFAAAMWFAAHGLAQTPNPPKPAEPARKSALDKATLEAYVRHLFVLDSNIKVEVGDPKPSDVPGLMDVVLKASLGERSEDYHFLVSKDGSKILQANVYDTNQNPFKADLDKIKTALSPSFGTPGATVVLVEFSDFQCPYCKEEAQMLRQNLLAAYPKQVRLYFKEFPLENLHPWAKAAAIAGRCVFRQVPASFWSYHDWIFGHQDGMTPENLKSKVLEWAGTQKDLKASQLSQCIDTNATESEVAESVKLGHDLGVGGTPTLFVNGRRIPNTIDWNTLRSVIDNEIEYQKTAHNAGEDCGCSTTLQLPVAPTLPGGIVKK